MGPATPIPLRVKLGYGVACWPLMPVWQGFRYRPLWQYTCGKLLLDRLSRFGMGAHCIVATTPSTRQVALLGPLVTCRYVLWPDALDSIERRCRPRQIVA
jgi:hypothetical protein